MSRFRSILLLWTLLSLPVISGDIYYIGNSLTNHYLPWVVQQFAADHPHDYQVSLINGAGLRYQWENHANTNNGIDSWLHLPTGQYQKLMLNESVPLTSAYTWNRPAQHARLFAELALPARPDLQLFLYGTWPHLVNAPNHPWTKPTWSEEIDGDRVMMEAIATQIEAELSLQKPVVIVPASQVLRRLRAAIDEGSVPGLTQFETLFEDDIHLSPLGHYVVGLVFYASFFNANPQGLTGTIPGIWGGTYVEVEAAQRTRIQELVWEVVQQTSRSGVDLALDDDQDGVPNVQDACIQSNTDPEIRFNSCQSGVANLLVEEGCTLADLFSTCTAAASTREDAIACIADQIERLVGQEVLSVADGAMLQNCAQSVGVPDPIIDVFTPAPVGQNR